MAGILAAGMNWAQTGSQETGEIDVKETIDFLEAGAICMSSEDRRKEKVAVEKACYLLKDRCTFEVIETIKRMDKVK